ncbi:MAG: hypothetical protein HYV93_07995 [Candidatus Rokubacteria bacterium]|nr:hypothetical protein [Candidatus Rokubacteria bacterium]
MDGLGPPPHYDGVGRDTRGTQSRLRDHTALTVFAQTLGRRDLSRLRLDCGGQAAEGTYHYAVRGTEVSACS